MLPRGVAFTFVGNIVGTHLHIIGLVLSHLPGLAQLSPQTGTHPPLVPMLPPVRDPCIGSTFVTADLSLLGLHLSLMARPRTRGEHPLDDLSQRMTPHCHFHEGFYQGFIKSYLTSFCSGLGRADMPAHGH